MKPARSNAAVFCRSLDSLVGASALAALLLSPVVVGQSGSPACSAQVLAPSGSTGAESLQGRLFQLNRYISTKGLHDFPSSQEKLPTGYAYAEFYD